MCPAQTFRELLDHAVRSAQINAQINRSATRA
jgi:hypothetical protein